MTTILSMMKTTSFSRIAQLATVSQILIWLVNVHGVSASKRVVIHAMYNCLGQKQFWANHFLYSPNKYCLRARPITKPKDLNSAGEVTEDWRGGFSKWPGCLEYTPDINVFIAKFWECARRLKYPENLTATSCRIKYNGKCCAWTSHAKFEVKMSADKDNYIYLLTFDVEKEKVEKQKINAIRIFFERKDKGYGEDKKWEKITDTLKMPQVIYRIFREKVNAEYGFFSFCGKCCRKGVANCHDFVKIARDEIMDTTITETEEEEFRKKIEAHNPYELTDKEFKRKILEDYRQLQEKIKEERASRHRAFQERLRLEEEQKRIKAEERLRAYEEMRRVGEENAEKFGDLAPEI